MIRPNDLGILFAYVSSKVQTSLDISAVSTEPLLIALKRKNVDEGSGQIVYTSSCDLRFYRICEQQLISEPAHFAVSPEPSLIVLK